MNNENIVSAKTDLSLPWKTIVSATSCYPEYEEESLFVIKNYISYLPSEAIYIPHQLFIKSCLAAYYRGGLDKESLLKELEFHCKRIRNDDMKKYGWARNQKYGEDDYVLYETHLGAFKDKAHQRLCEVLECELTLEYSLSAELYLRQVFLDDNYHDDQPYGLFENRAVTIFAYRMTLMTESPEAADERPLYGQLIYEAIGFSPFNFEEIY